MEQHLYMVFDRQTGKYSHPMFFNNQVEMFRALGEVVKDTRSMLSKFPDAFQIFHVGFLDLDTGIFNKDVEATFICNVLEFVTKA